MPMRLLFLRSNGYFFDSGKGTYWTNHLDPFIADLLKGSTSEPKIETLLQISIINSSAFLHYRDNLGKICTRKRPPTPCHNVGSSYPELAKWIETSGPQVGSQQDKYNVSLGPRGQFFALSNLGYRWHGVPDEFHGHIQDMLAGGGRWKEGWEPSGALFGVNNSYLITCKGGRHLAFSSNLSKQYPGLEKRVRERFDPARGGGRVYDYVSLNPYVANEWVVVWADDTVSWSLPPSILELAGPVSNWLSNKAGVYTAPSPSPSLSTTTSASSTPTLPSSPPSHKNSNAPVPSSTQTASFKPSPIYVPKPRPLLTGSNPAPARPIYHNSYPTPTGTSSRYPNYATSYKTSHHPSYQTLSYTTNASTRPPLPGQSHSTPVPSRPLIWTQPNDTSTKEMLHFLHAFGKQMSQFSNNDSSSANSFGAGGFGAGGSSLFQSPFQSGGDPTGDLFSGLGAGGGMGLPGFDPGSMANAAGGGMMGMGGMGLDPSSLMFAQSQCVIM